MSSTDLYIYAEKNGIEILTTSCKKTGSISLMENSGNCYIGIDTADMTEQDEKIHLAHELGHCATGAFYNRHSPFDLRSRHEARANKWAIKKLVPKNELEKLFRRGITEIWEISEYFGISEDFARKACTLYGFLRK